MANLYEFEINRGIVEELVKDIGLSPYEDDEGNIAKGTVVDNLISSTGDPRTFLKVLMDGKPGIHLRVGEIRTERFEGQGLHMYTHSGTEGFLDTREFDRRLKQSLERQRIIFQDRTPEFKQTK